MSPCKYIHKYINLNGLYELKRALVTSTPRTHPSVIVKIHPHFLSKISLTNSKNMIRRLMNLNNSYVIRGARNIRFLKMREAGKFVHGCSNADATCNNINE